MGDEREAFEKQIGRGKVYSERDFEMWQQGRESMQLEVDRLIAHERWLERRICDHIVARSKTLEEITKWAQIIVDKDPSQSLIQHDNALIERMANLCERKAQELSCETDISLEKYCVQRARGANECAEAIRKEMEGLSDEK